MSESSGYQDTGSLDEPQQQTEGGPDNTGSYDPPGVATPAEQEGEEQRGEGVSTPPVQETPAAPATTEPAAPATPASSPAPGSTGTSGGVGSE